MLTLITLVYLPVLMICLQPVFPANIRKGVAFCKPCLAKCFTQQNHKGYFKKTSITGISTLGLFTGKAKFISFSPVSC